MKDLELIRSGICAADDFDWNEALAAVDRVETVLRQIAEEASDEWAQKIAADLLGIDVW